MPVSVAEFWKLLIESRLATVEQLRPIKEKFATVKGAETQGNSLTLSEWLVANGVVSRYQAKVLMAGRPGPFRFGEYVVYDRHGGPFKGAFKAIHPATRQQVVLSFFTGAATQNPHMWSIIVQQMAVLSRAVHPNICRVFQLCDTGSYKFAVVEYLRGQSVDAQLAGGGMNWPVACRIVRQVALGLIKLLEVGQLHGEVRPANIWLDRQENAKLLLPPLARDPLALPRPINIASTDPNRIAIIADFLAPELVRDGQAPSASTDIYALGCMLFQLIAGCPPFSRGDVATKLRSHVAEAFPSLESLRVPPLVSHVLASMTAKNPVLRFQHPQLVVDALAGILEQFEPAQLAWPASPVAPTQEKYDVWLGQQPIVPTLPQVESPPISIDVAPSPIDPAEMPLIHEPVVQTSAAAPIAAASITLPQSDFLAVMATSAAPPSEPAFEFDLADHPASGSATAMDLAFPLSVEGADSAANVSQRVVEKRKQQRRRLLKFVGGMIALGLAAGTVFFISTQVSNSDPKSESLPTAATPPSDDLSAIKDDSLDGQSDNAARHVGASGAQSDEIAIVADDGATLWESPTHGSPPKLEYIAPAAQSLLFVRPSELLKHPEGEKLLTALGPRGEAARKELESVVGPLGEIERLTIAWVDPLTADSTGAGGWPLVPMFVVRFAKPHRDLLTAKWGNPQGVDEAGEKVYPTPIGSAFFPAKFEQKTLVVGPAAQIKDVIKLNGSTSPVRLELAKLLTGTDEQRLATLLVVPEVAFGSQSTFLSGELQSLARPAHEFVGVDSRGANLSLHFAGDNLFLELRVLNAAGTAANVAADRIRARTANLPEAIERLIAGLQPHPYGAYVLMRFPQMIELLKEFTRVGIDDGETVLRCYLPAAAAHNLALGAELAFAEASEPAAVNRAANSASGGSTPPSQSVAERLKRKTSLNFARDTLEKALVMLADDVEVKIEILGGDLQLEGITKNQSFGLSEQDKPADEILRNIMLKANPDGKLVYVIKPKVPGGEEMLFITTRSAVAKRGDKLPAELALPEK
ncbi:MAG: protein kinase [Pirellulales bacterium]|nr:protein kinase [Pirellulales bacterium]